MPRFNIARAKQSGFGKEEIIDLMVDEGASDDQIKSAISEYDNIGSQAASRGPEQQDEPLPGFAQTIFPRRSALGPESLEKEKGFMGAVRGASASLSDLGSLPGRMIFSAPSVFNKNKDLAEEVSRTRGTRELPLVGDPTKDPLAPGSLKVIANIKKGIEDFGRSPAAGVMGVGTRLLGPLASKLPALIRPAAAGLAEAIPEIAAGQAESYAEKGKAEPGRAAIEGVLSAGIPALSQFGNALLGKMAGELSGATEEALRRYGTGLGKEAKTLRSAAGTEMKIGKKLADMIDDFDQYLPEKNIVNRALDEMPPIDINPILSVLKKSKVIEGTNAAKTANKSLDGLSKMWSTLAKKNSGNITAQEFREIRKQLDSQIKSTFSKDQGAAGILEEKLKSVRKAMKEALVNSAEESGRPEYAAAMESWSDKLGKLEDIKSYLGGNSATRHRRAEAFADNLFNKNKSVARQTVSDIGEIFGEDFVSEAKLAQLAQELGPGGTPTIFPKQFTGRSIAAAAAAPFTAGASLIAGSPRAASTALAATEGLRKFASKGKVSPLIIGGGKAARNEEEPEYIKAFRRRFRK